MSSAPPLPHGLGPAAWGRRADPAWMLALAALALMFAPVYWAAAHVVWQTEENGHGPIVLAVLAWLWWSQREAIASAEHRPASVLGWSLFAFGVVMYLFGRLFVVSSVEFAAQIPIVAALLLLLRGPAALRVAWFPLAWMYFVIPLPATLIDALTGPLKQWISGIVETMLYGAGYPVARSGVILSVGQYQLMVADACSGINSMFSLSALGTLFLWIMKRRRVAHNAIMLAAILPIAFAANVVRVIVLVLVTYYLGDEAGQGFLHGAAGMLLMLVALLLLFALDAALKRALPERPKPARS